MILDQVPADKARHFIAGSVAGVTGALLASQLHLPPWQCAAGLALLAGLLKEAADAYANVKATGKVRGVPVGFPHGVEGLDALATTLGGVVVALPWIWHG